MAPFYKSHQSLLEDNFFTSLPLADKLWIEGITLVGTVNANKNLIPDSFFKSRRREILSSLFVFRNYLTLMSYVPKKNKSVILLSTHHHSAEIDYDQVANKPQIINYYNSTKGKIYKI